MVVRSKRPAKPHIMGRFLLLEDRPEQIRVLTRRLEAHRPVDLATSVSEARVRLNQGGPYVGYVFDLNLPDGSGIELLRELRHVKNDAVPAIIVTACAIDRALALDAGALGRLLPKPGTDLSPEGFVEGLSYFVSEALAFERTQLGPRAALFDISDGELTGAQMDVAVLGVLGYTRHEIAERLGITVHTARSHIRDVLMKTGFRGRGLAALAREVNQRQGSR